MKKMEDNGMISLNTDVCKYVVFDFGRGPLHVVLFKQGKRTRDNRIAWKDARTGKIAFHRPFSFEEEAEIVLAFLKSIAEDAFSYGIRIHEEYKKEQVEYYDREKKVFILTNGMEVPVSSLMDEFEEKGDK
jgi:hypothetical protein